ncbi:PepSY domain-containing protein [Rhizobium leguminosarum]|uniref:PepSY domain-containing protein n=1 Tax=Rhizobium leguminosarum TaxID=384 RepID=UPI0021B10B78|nr:PepSY domain-containing protein [Rhizobium leguminosarum]
MSHNTLKAAIAAVIAIGSLGLAATTSLTPAMAAEQKQGQDDATEYSKLAGVKLGLADAITAAEKQFGGKAVNAALDNEQASAAFEVELMTDNGSQTVSVDGETGQVKHVADTAEGTGGEDAE